MRSTTLHHPHPMHSAARAIAFPAMPTATVHTAIAMDSRASWRVESMVQAGSTVGCPVVQGAPAVRTVAGVNQPGFGHGLRSLATRTEQLPCATRYLDTRLNRFFGEGKCLRPHRGAGPMG